MDNKTSGRRLFGAIDMHGYLVDHDASRVLFFGVWIAYMVTCLTRNSYSTAIAAIVSEGLFTKSESGTISAAFYLFYGTAQFVGGYLADRISPSVILLFGLIGSLITNGIMASTESFTVMLVTWSINGICQFGVWPATLKIVSSVLAAEHRKRALGYISLCMCVGCVTGYFAAMLLLRNGRWPSLFWFSVVLSGMAAVMWVIVCVRTKPMLRTYRKKPSGNDGTQVANTTESEPTEQPSALRLMLISGFIILLVPTVFRCMLDNGAKSWVPTMMMESYGMTPGTSSFVAMVVLAINSLGMFLVELVPKKLRKNDATATAFLFGCSLPLFGLLLLIGKIPMIGAVVLLVAATTVMYAISVLLSIRMPAAFSKYQMTGRLAGITNAFGSYGVMLGNFCYGFIADGFGWTAVIVTWLILAAISAVCCLAAARAWKRFGE